MARAASEQPTEVELQILRILWQAGPSSARQVHNELQKSKQTNYSTTVKMLGVMLEKGLLDRDDSVRPQQFRAAVTRKRAQSKMLRGLINKLYEGSTKSLVMQALSTRKASKQELAEIRSLIDQLEEEGDAS